MKNPAQAGFFSALPSLLIQPDEVFTVSAEVSKHSFCDVDPSIPQGEREKLKASSGRINRLYFLPFTALGWILATSSACAHKPDRAPSS